MVVLLKCFPFLLTLEHWSFTFTQLTIHYSLFTITHVCRFTFHITCTSAAGLFQKQFFRRYKTS